MQAECALKYCTVPRIGASRQAWPLQDALAEQMGALTRAVRRSSSRLSFRFRFTLTRRRRCGNAGWRASLCDGTIPTLSLGLIQRAISCHIEVSSGCHSALVGAGNAYRGRQSNAPMFVERLRGRMSDHFANTFTDLMCFHTASAWKEQCEFVSADSCRCITAPHYRRN